MSDPLHIMHAVLSLDVGGLERFVLDLIRAGRRSGQRVSVLCLERPGALAAEAESAGANVFCANKPPGLRWTPIREIERILRGQSPDCLHTHQITALYYSGPAARRAGIPVVHTEHGKNYSGNRRAQWLGWIAARSASQFVCVSRDIAAEVAACRIAPMRKIGVVANGINLTAFDEPIDRDDLRRSLGCDRNAFVIGTVGRLAEIKRQDILIRAFAALSKQFANARLLLVGDGPLRGELESLAGSLGVRDAARFAGYQSAPQKYLRAMDVFALNSRSEGMPLAVLEAWAAGLPVAATNVGGIPELIAHGVTGLLFAPGDVDACAATLRTLLVDADLRQRLAAAGQRRVRAEFSIARTAENYLSRYQAAIAGVDPAAEAATPSKSAAGTDDAAAVSVVASADNHDGSHRPGLSEISEGARRSPEPAASSSV